VLTSVWCVGRPTPYNGPGRIDRANGRAPGIVREGPVTPRKLGHVVIGSTDQDATQRFFTEGIGLKVSDVVPSIAAFMRCSTDHHNVLVQQAPVNFLHHTSWQVQDIDEIGRGAMSMLEENPERHVWEPRLCPRPALGRCCPLLVVVRCRHPGGASTCPALRMPGASGTASAPSRAAHRLMNDRRADLGHQIVELIE
jgi:hypothetical protein